MSNSRSSELPTPASSLPKPDDSQNQQDKSSDFLPPLKDIHSPEAAPSPCQNDSPQSLDAVAAQANPTIAPTSLSARLKLQTDRLEEQKKHGDLTISDHTVSVAEAQQQTVFNAGLPVRSSSIRSVLGSRAHRSDSLSPASAVSSPAIGPLVDMTPLPSPISAWGTPGYGRSSIDSDLDPDATVAGQTRDSPPEPITFSRTSPKKRRIPDNLEQIYNANAAALARNRSISEYVPEAMQVPRSRNIVVSTSGTPSIEPSSFSPPEDERMHRERHLAVRRGLAISIPKPPTPPESNRGKDSDELEISPTASTTLDEPMLVVYEARTVRGGRLRKWRAIRQLGKGTFSTVMLATSEGLSRSEVLGNRLDNEDQLSPKSLVAVKICEQGPAGGADEKKIETSIKRETEIMKSIDHPSLVHLKAFETHERQTFLVLNYCPGGDLFELANNELDILTPSLIRRMFTELVGAARYLHDQYIVHRDIKLESRS